MDTFKNGGKQEASVRRIHLNSLRSKIVIPFVLLILLAALIPGFVAIYQGSNILISRAQKSNFLLAQAASRNLDILLKEKMTTVKGIAKLDSLKRMNPKQIDKDIENIRSYEEGFTSLIVIDVEGKIDVVGI